MYSQANFKGCDLALEGFELARRAVPELELVTFGAQAPNAKLPLPRGARFTLLPPQDQIRNLYASCDAWMVTSRCEGFGMPTLEAMSCHTPVIATATGAAPEILAGGGGILLDTPEPKLIADAIERIARLSDADWRAMSATARATALTYQWDEATRNFESALERTIAANRSRQPQPA